MAFVAALALVGCTDGTTSAGGDAGNSSVPLTWLKKDLPPIDLPNGAELTNQCWSWTLHNEEPIYVHTVHMTTTKGVHHSNWFYVTGDTYAAPDGTDGDGLWKCSDRDFNTVVAAGSGGVLFAQSTQNTDELQEFQDGAALKLPPHARIMVDLHLLNFYGEDLAPQIHLEVGSIPEESVDTQLKGFAIEYVDLHIPPRSKSTFTTRCNFETFHESLFGRPVDFHLHYLLPHYHSLGNLLRLQVYGGPHDGEIIYQTTDHIGGSLSARMDPPYDMTGALGMTVTCGYDNQSDSEIVWGVGNNEMCVLFGFTDSKATWGGGVLTDGQNEVVGTDADGTVLNEAPCGMIGIVR